MWLDVLRTSVTRKAASVKAGAALAVCMLALTTTACSNSERESDALADAPSEATDTNRDVPPETNEFLEGDEGHSITYIRLHDGCLLYTSPSPRDRQKSRMPSSA